MRILLAAIGKMKAGPEARLFAHYAERLPWALTVKEHELKKTVTAEARKALEGAWLLQAAAEADHIIALDERGKDWGSAVFAKHLERKRDTGARSIAFLIGGADGLSEGVRMKADATLCFGRATWPHMLVRGLLAEQLYRAHTILAGHPYHRI